MAKKKQQQGNRCRGKTGYSFICLLIVFSNNFKLLLENNNTMIIHEKLYSVELISL